jgi:ATP-dependent DNA helicase RecG
LPGVLFIGAKDDGSSSGLDVTDDLLLQLANMKTDGNIIPPPSITVAKEQLGGAWMAVVTVFPSDSPPVRYKGRTYIRIGPRKGIATAREEQILVERRRHGNRPFDVRPVHGSTLGDLSRMAFEADYLPSAVAPDVLAANDRSFEERLAALKMVTSADEPLPTVLGHLVLGIRTRDFIPGAFVQFLRVNGIDLADPIVDELEIDGTVADIVRRLEEKLAAHNRVSVEFTSAATERRQAQYAFSALQQLTRNAVMHRTYEYSNSPIRVSWFNDRIEILSPGGPYGTVTRENFGRPGVTDYRNPSLAEALKVLGFVQRFGAGIATAQRELLANGNPPAEFAIEQTYINTLVRAKP